MTMLSPVKVALYGANGHQVHELIAANPRARLVAAAAFPIEKLPAALRNDPEVRWHPTFEQLIADPAVELVSLCSPRRRDQANDAIRALRAGKHVYAEKPSAFTEADLDRVLREADGAGRRFREMAGTAFEPPYHLMRDVVGSGRIGRVVQVIAEKSYPYHDGRPQDEDVDGGLIRQCAVHALRFVEHVAGARILDVQAFESGVSNPVPDGGLRMAASLVLRLEGGGLASIAANYRNPKGTGIWGYETLRIVGERGFVESTHGGRHTRLVIDEQDFGALRPSGPGLDYFDAYLRAIRGVGEMPLTSEQELSPTRWAIRAKESATTVCGWMTRPVPVGACGHP